MTPRSYAIPSPPSWPKRRLVRNWRFGKHPTRLAAEAPRKRVIDIVRSDVGDSTQEVDGRKVGFGRQLSCAAYEECADPQ